MNIASYALLANILATRAGLQVRTLNMQLGHVHIYDSHIDSLMNLIASKLYNDTVLRFDTDKIVNAHDVADLEPSDFSVNGYKDLGKVELELIT